MRQFYERLIDLRWPLLFVALAIGAASVYWAQSLGFDQSIESMLAADDGLLEPYAKLKRTFGGNEVALAAYVDPNLMTPDGMRRLSVLRDRLAATPGVAAVLSINSGPLGDRVIDADSPSAAAYVRLFEGYAIGADRQTAAVACMLEPTHLAEDRAATVAALRQAVEDQDPTGVLTGEPVMVVEGFRYLQYDGLSLGWVSTLLLMLTIVLCFRSLRWVVAPLAVTQLALVATQALLVASRLRLSMVSSMLSAIVTVVAIATTVHLIVRFRELRTAGRTPREALVDAATELSAPIFWSLVTDAVGFGSLILSKVGPVHDFGVMMVVGSLMVAPAMLLLLPGLALIGNFDRDPRRAWGERGLDVGLASLSRWIEHRPKLLWTISLVVSALAAVGCFKLKVETDFTKNFREGSPIVRSYAFVETRLGGAGVWDVIVPAPEVMTMKFLRKLRKLETRLRTEAVVVEDSGRSAPGLTKVLSVNDAVESATLGRLDKLPLAFMRDNGARATIAEMRRQMPKFMQALIGADPLEPESHYVRIMLRARERQEADQKQSLIDQVRTICLEEFPNSQTTGFYVLLTRLIESTTRDQWLTFGVASAGIAVTMLLAFGDWKLALIALAPNALPVLMVTGLMGWLQLKVNMGAAMIAAVSMGLSVDSSIHYIRSFRDFRQQGVSLHEALARVHQGVGRAMIFSTLSLLVGFSALCFSQFIPTIYFGALVGLTMLGGLVGNLVLLPLLLAWRK